jgi:hypothetical protein
MPGKMHGLKMQNKWWIIYIHTSDGSAKITMHRPKVQRTKIMYYYIGLYPAELEHPRT